MAENVLPAYRALTALQVADTVRGAVNLVLSELDGTSGPEADICRYQELADECPAFAAVTVEGTTAVEEYGDWASFTIPVVNGRTFRVLVMPTGVPR